MLHTLSGQMLPRAVQVIALATKEAQRLNHGYIGADHLLLGLVRLGHSCLSLEIFLQRKIRPDHIKTAVEKKMAMGGVVLEGSRSFTPHLLRVFVLARMHAKNMNHRYVGTEHLVLGILSSEEGVAHRVLTQDFGLTVEMFTEDILRSLHLDPSYFEMQTAS